MLALLFKTIIPRLVLWLKSTSKGFIIYSRKIKFSYFSGSINVTEKLLIICFNIGHQKLVLQWGDTFLKTRKVHNAAAWHHVDLNRIQWASNLGKPEKLFNTYLLQNCLPFLGYFIFLMVFRIRFSFMFLPYLVPGLKQIYITNFGNHLVIPHA